MVAVITVTNVTINGLQPAMTRPVDFDLQNFLPYRLNKAAERVSLSFAAEYKARYGMTRPEWRTLAALGSLGEMSATGIGAHSSMHKTKVSRAVKSLEDRRWLTRLQSNDDRRVELLLLTTHGQEAYAKLARVAEAYAASLLALLGKEAIAHLEAGLGALEEAKGLGFKLATRTKAQGQR